MPRFFFDLHRGPPTVDDVGTELAGFDEARVEAIGNIPEIVRQIEPSNGDQQSFSVTVRNEAGAVIYVATMAFTGLRLIPSEP